MKANKVFFLVFLIMLSLLVFNTKPVGSQFSGTIYIRSDGSVDPVIAPIRRDGNTYTLTGNIYGSIVVQRGNITVDGVGYALQGTGNGTAITVSSTGFVAIKKIVINYFGLGIDLQSDGSTVSGNKIANCTFGVYIRSSNNKITGNNLTANRSGIFVGGAKNSVIYENIIAGNQWGIHVTSTNPNIILGNNVTSNQCGVYCEGWSGNQIFYHNNFVNNRVQVQDAGLTAPWVPGIPLSIHSWDNGEEGNYWSDYNGTDIDGDGVGDMPYHINAKGPEYHQAAASNQDPYPLMKPVDISNVTIPTFPDNTPPTVAIVSPENKTYGLYVPLTLAVDEPTSWRSYSLDGQANVTISRKTTLANLSDGTHSLNAYAKDLFGNMGSSGKVYFTIDTFHPIISILSPENKTYDTNTIALNFTVTKTTSWTGYSLDGRANVTITGNTTLTGLSDGMHNLVVYAVDAAGNLGTSEMVYFTIKTQKPGFLGSNLPTEQGYAIIAVIAVAVAATAGYLYLKRKKK